MFQDDKRSPRRENSEGYQACTSDKLRRVEKGAGGVGKAVQAATRRDGEMEG